MLLYDEIRATRDAMRYGFAVGKVRVLETKMLDRSAVERLLDARDFVEQKRLLSDTAYGRYLEDATTAREVELALDDALDSYYGYLDDAELPAPVVRFFRVRYDYANLKALLKSEVLGVPLDGLLVGHGTVPISAFEEGPDALTGDLAEVAHSLEDETDVFRIDVAVDRAYFRELKRCARMAKSRYLESLAELMVDIGNVKIVLRATAAQRSPEEITGIISPGGGLDLSRAVESAVDGVQAVARELVKSPALKALTPEELANPAALDLATDAMMASALRRGRREAAGPEPVIAYVMGREAEVRTLRVLLLGTLTGIEFETLRARVGAAYR